MKKIIIYSIVLLVGLALGYLLKDSNQASTKEHVHMESMDEETVWTCSMHPQIKKNEPGLCPLCGMDLIPLEDDAKSTSNPQEIRMSPTAMQLANVVTEVVTKKKASKTLDLNGEIKVNETQVTTQTTHIGGRIEQLNVSYTGEYVSKGQIIAYVYAPELVIAQNELLDAYRFKEEQPEIYNASREKIKNWKITDQQINQIIKTGKVKRNFPVLSNLDGIITSKYVNMGDHVMTGGPLFEIANLSTVWAMFDVYENDLSKVEKGDDIEFTITAIPGKQFNGAITFIDPLINTKTRTAKARVNLNNKDNTFKPGMFIKGHLSHQISDSETKIVIPKSAVMWTGKRSVVYVKTNTDSGFGFTLREVILGESLGKDYVILKGLKGGEIIATQGAFSIDAAAQLAGKPSMMNPNAGKSSEDINHEMFMESMYELGTSKHWVKDWNKLMEVYFLLKDDLIEDNLQNAQKNGRIFKKHLNMMQSDFANDNMTKTWMNVKNKLLKDINAFNTTESITTARVYFKAISDQMIQVIKGLNLKENTLYIHTCPMAVDNKEGEWLSKEREILNPYMGASMLRCGTMKEKLN